MEIFLIHLAEEKSRANINFAQKTRGGSL